MGSIHIEKRCGCCATVKPVAEFYRSHQKRDAYCRACRRVKDRERQSKHSPEKLRSDKLMSLYGLSLHDYTRMYVRQNGVCMICLQAEDRKTYGGKVAALSVDHNHENGKVRGLLCHRCNTRLATIEDEQFMLAAKRYLRNQGDYEFVDDSI